jgi:hypothetical protein
LGAATPHVRRRERVGRRGFLQLQEAPPKVGPDL